LIGSAWSLHLGYARLLALAALVLTFAVFYPYLDATGSCGEPGCPHFAHAPASAELPAGVLVAALVVVPPALAGRVLRCFASDRKPAEIYLSPEPDPPRLYVGRTCGASPASGRTSV
jgi:hypothetical protein